MKVRFTATDTPYQKGSVYDLPHKEAEKFVRHGVAEKLSGSTVSKKKATSRRRAKPEAVNTVDAVKPEEETEESGGVGA